MLRERRRRARVDIDDRGRNWILLVCSASSVSSVNASRPHASATQIEWIPRVRDFRFFDRALEIRLALPIDSDC